MARKKKSKIAALALAAVMASEAGLTSFVPLAVQAKENIVEAESVNADNTGNTARFTWDNVTAYFVLTDRFVNGDTSNDHSYGRGLNQEGTGAQAGLDYKTNPGTFHGGDLKGLTSKVEDGYFTELGVNAIWLTAPYEQIHGYTSGNKYSNDAREPNGTGFPYYSFHGYWALDFSNIDANMGTEADFEKFVDACHERGIRVIMDVVLNHTGYITVKDCLDLDMKDALNDKSLGYYYGDLKNLVGGDTEREVYYNLDSDDWNNKWWGGNFVRVNNDYKGYKNVGKSAGLTSTLCALPDIYTESETEVALPGHLKKLWTDAGRYDEETKELEEFFGKTGLKKTPRNYVVKWLTDWVRDYGVDGYRCDTAAHVDKQSWGILKEQAVAALKEWRQNNPDKPGADWTDDFWMTGESWGHGVGKDDYYTTGGFDSMINFSFPKGGDLGSLEGTYSSYASTINSDEDFNVLSYIASHDDKSCSSLFGCDSTKNKNLATSLLLSPGGVQIYYGNETNRGLGWTNLFEGDGAEYHDLRYRTDMNWGENQDNLAHWQKIGQFRNNHPAVGAGQHKKLDGDAYTFSRTYHLEDEDEDKVVVSIPGKSGTYKVSVGDVFDEGETLTDFYSGKSYTVAGGEVSAECDANGVILLQGSGIVRPSVNAKLVSGSTTYKTETIQVDLRANKVTNATYSINGGTEVPYNEGDILTLGGGTAYGEKTILTLSAVSEEDGSEITKTITYTKCDEPIVSNGFCVKVKKSEFSTAPNIYLYTNDGEEKALDGAWPGPVLEEDPTDSSYWSYENEDITGEAVVILSLGATSNSPGTWRTTPDKADGIVIENAVEYDKTSNKFSEIPAGDPGRVNVKYVDQAGNELKSVYRVGAVGKQYTTSAATIEGYTLVETPKNAEGIFEKESTVTYVYAAGEGVVTPTVTPTIEPTVTDTPTVTVGPTVTDTPTVTTAPTITDTPTVTAEPTVSPVPGQFVLNGLTAVKTKDGVRLIADAEGETGEIRYMFSFERDGKEILIQNFQSFSEIIWTPSETGTYKINVYAINNGTILDKTIENYSVK